LTAQKQYRVGEVSKNTILGTIDVRKDMFNHNSKECVKYSLVIRLTKELKSTELKENGFILPLYTRMHNPLAWKCQCETTSFVFSELKRLEETGCVIYWKGGDMNKFLLEMI
jgi:hypothetical protein